MTLVLAVSGALPMSLATSAFAAIVLSVTPVLAQTTSEPTDLVRHAARNLMYGSEDDAVDAVRRLMACRPQDGARDLVHEAVRKIQYGNEDEAVLALRRLISCRPIDASDADSSANPFDSCVLDHMRNVVSDVAATSIKQACVRSAEQALTQGEIGRVFSNPEGGYISFNSYGTVEKAFYIKFQNGSDYSISEITVRLSDDSGHDQTFTLQRFLFMSWIGHAIAAPPPDPTYNMALRPGDQAIYFNLAYTPFVDHPAGIHWSLVSAKGWH
jgi:hypothetical protein